jgi:hypothetical protein
LEGKEFLILKTTSKAFNYDGKLDNKIIKIKESKGVRLSLYLPTFMYPTGAFQNLD